MKKNARTPAVTLSRVEALRMAYGCQFHPGQRLDGSTAGVPDIAENAAGHLRRIGHVQIDTISVVERAHHHVFWSRDRNYGPPVLPLLEATPRRAAP